jgi:hypothetical protein
VTLVWPSGRRARADVQGRIIRRKRKAMDNGFAHECRSRRALHVPRDALDLGRNGWADAEPDLFLVVHGLDRSGSSQG